MIGSMIPQAIRTVAMMSSLLLLLGMMMEIPVCHGLSMRGNSNNDNNNGATRREFVQVVPLVSFAGLLLAKEQAALAFDAADDISGNSLPFCVIGANGRTGTKCVTQLLQANLPVRATSRSGVYNTVDDNDNDAASKASSKLLLRTMVCDVTQPATVDAVVRGTRAVIFAASASKQGGTPAQVDNDGLVTVAKACIANQVPHLVVVSSGGVSKPDSTIYKFLNLFGGIMKEKIQGEDLVRSLYAQVDVGAPTITTFTIIRPGGLTEEPGLGAAALELSQGDVKSGRISRNDVASLCIQATLYPKLTGGTTFECYNADTGKTLGEVGFSNLTKQKSDPASLVADVTGRERRGDTWEGLFTGLEKA
jgi:nucleoside-diphosphate-sugar epimerase